jgi:hypothetical protein
MGEQVTERVLNALILIFDYGVCFVAYPVDSVFANLAYLYEPLFVGFPIFGHAVAENKRGDDESEYGSEAERQKSFHWGASFCG